VIHDADEVARRTLRMVTEGVIRSVDGKDLPVACDTVLLHGDSPGAIALAGRIREELLAAGVEITSLDKVLSGTGA
jgi:UPF0271 protein